MEKLAKYLVFICLITSFSVYPGYAQRGGGHSGGSGGGHFSGGSGGRSFGGGGGHFGGGFSGNHFSGGGRPSVNASQQRGFQNNSIASQRGNTARGQQSYRGTNSTYITNNYRGYNGGYGHGSYYHGGYGRGFYAGNYGWGRHGGYFYNRGFYGSVYFPYIGLGFGYLPYGYYPFYWEDAQYFYSNGFYYQRNNEQYTVVEPPVGAIIKNLPSDAQAITINGQQYYEQSGVYYTAVTMADGSAGYQIAGKDGVLNTNTNGTTTVTPKIGDMVTQLPADCHQIKINGETYLVSQDGIYYQETKDENGNKVYKIVGLEGDQPK